MASIDIMKPEGTRLVVVRSMPQTTKRFIFRSAPSFVNPDARSPAMLKAEIAFGQEMISLRGTYGHVQRSDGTVISRTAQKAGEALYGKNYGGLPYLDRLALHREGAEEHIGQLQTILSKKGQNGESSRFMAR